MHVIRRMILAYITEQLWLPYCKWRSHNPHSLWAFVCNTSAHICQSTTNYNIQVILLLYICWETKRPTKLQMYHTFDAYIWGMYMHIWATYKVTGIYHVTSSVVHMMPTPMPTTLPICVLHRLSLPMGQISWKIHGQQFIDYIHSSNQCFFLYPIVSMYPLTLFFFYLIPLIHPLTPFISFHSLFPYIIPFHLFIHPIFPSFISFHSFVHLLLRYLIPFIHPVTLLPLFHSIHPLILGIFYLIPFIHRLTPVFLYLIPFTWNSWAKMGQYSRILKCETTPRSNFYGSIL